LKLENIHVGDFVRCRSKYHRSQLEITEDPGLVIEIKRSNSKVLYPDDKRVWLPREMTTRVRADAGYAPLLQKLNYLLKRVHAHECEFVAGSDIHRLSVQIDEIDAAVVDDIRSYLGNDYLSLRVVPEGMAFMQVQIEFKANPLSANLS
jgi:hypothetical protein